MLCECGCGNETPLTVKGEPGRFLKGHAGGMARRRERMTPDLWTVTDGGYETPCWIWNGTRKNRWGHCAVWISGREYSAHRRLYEQEVGPIGEGLELDHLCANPPCVNPAHLEPVTHALNIQRSRLAKLTREQVDDIRASALRAVELAEKYGVTRGTIHAIRARTTWK